MMFANRGDIVPALTMLVQTQEPEISQSAIYMLKLLRDTFPAATWADFVAFSNSGVNDERILNMMSVNTSDRAFNAQVLRNYRAGVNRLNGLYATNGFFRGMVDTPNYRSFKILSLLLATFNVIGRESKVEIPTFSNIIGDMGIATGSWGSAADTAAFLRAIYNLRNTGGRQLSHPEESPIVLARKAVNLFKKDGKLDPAEVGNVLSQRQVRIDEVRKSKNPTPEYDGNQLVNLVSLFVGDQGNTSIADGNKVEMFPKN
jgi:hypothetical protein